MYRRVYGRPTRGMYLREAAGEYEELLPVPAHHPLHLGGKKGVEGGEGSKGEGVKHFK